MIQIEITFLNAVKLSSGIIQMLDRETPANTFIFLLEEEEMYMLLDELNEYEFNYTYRYEKL